MGGSLDADSYRSKATGNLIRTIVSKGWLKASFSYKYLTPDEYKTISDMIKNYPLYVKVKDPRFTGGYIECEVYCSKSSGEMLETGAYNMSFNLIQSRKGTWQ